MWNVHFDNLNVSSCSVKATEEPALVYTMSTPYTGTIAFSNSIRQY